MGMIVSNRLIMVLGIVFMVALSTWSALNTQIPVQGKRPQHLSSSVAPFSICPPLCSIGLGVLRETLVADKVSTNTQHGLQDVEPSIAVNPSKPGPNYNIIVSFTEIYPASPGWTLGAKYSTNGGQTWSPSPIPTNPVNPNDIYSRPRTDSKIAFDSLGNAYLVGLGIGYTVNVFVIKSTPNGSGDAGTTWSNYVTVSSNSNDDRPDIAVDSVVNRAGGSMPTNYIYVAWQRAGVEYIVRSTNGGSIFSSPVCVESGCPATGWSNDMAIGPNGEIYIILISGTERVCKSTSWPTFTCISPPQLAYTNFPSFNNCHTVGVPWQVPNACFRTTTLPGIVADKTGNVYAVWTSYTSGHGDIYSSKAAGGNINSWTNPVRVNHDLNGHDHWFPDIAYDPASGDIVSVFYDRRDDPNNILFNLYWARSYNSGVTFYLNGRISSKLSDPAVLLPSDDQFLGDYIDIDTIVVPGAKVGSFAVAWTDLRDGFTMPSDNNANIYFALLGPSATYGGPKWQLALAQGPHWLQLPNQPFLYSEIDRVVGYNSTETTNLTATNIPPGVSVSLTPSMGEAPFSFNMTISSPGLAAGDYSFDLFAASPSGNQTVTVPFRVPSGAFILPNQTYVNPGSILRITGKGFNPSGYLPIKINGTEISTTTANPQGDLDTTITMPDTLMNGTHRITVGPSPTGGPSANTTVQSPLPTPPEETAPRISIPTPYAPQEIGFTAGTAMVALPILRVIHRRRTRRRDAEVSRSSAQGRVET